MSTCIELEVVPQNPTLMSKSDGEMAIMVFSNEEQKPLLREDSDVVQLKARHTIFLSHSGVQKNFAEQLCEDLERANHAPFFDKRPDSLPKGEKFAQLILQAAQQCQLAIVVVSEEYFSRSKWPILELAAFVQADNCTILPLFFGISCTEFGNLERRQLWFERWDEWKKEDPRIQVDVWKEALRELDGRNRLEYIAAIGEVDYRRKVVATASTIVQHQVIPRWVLSVLKNTGSIVFKTMGTMICSICLVIVVGILFSRVNIKPFFAQISRFLEEQLKILLVMMESEEMKRIMEFQRKEVQEMMKELN